MAVTAFEVRPERAVVVPRGHLAGGGETLPLETHIRSMIRRNRLIAIVGVPGSGKSVAIAHLAQVFADTGLKFLDDPDLTELPSDRPAVAVCSNWSAATEKTKAVLLLAPWSESERIDYLLARHPTQVRRVMAELKGCDTTDEVGGSPEVWAILLDELAHSVCVDHVIDLYAVARKVIERDLVHLGKAAVAVREWMVDEFTAPSDVPKLLRHAFGRDAMTIQHMIDNMESPRSMEIWTCARSDGLIRGLGAVLRRNPVASALLGALIEDERWHRPVNAVSALLAADPSYRPGPRLRALRGVRAAGAKWSGLDLTAANLTDGDLARADLSGTELDGAILKGASLIGANLTGCRGYKAILQRAVMDVATFRNAQLENADFCGCRMHAADFNDAILKGASFTGADLSGASFERADLSFCHFVDTILRASDLTNALLESALLSGIDLRETILHGVRAHRASFVRSNLEGLSIENFDGTEARFGGSDLTASELKVANLRGASFVSAGLADIDWEGADLRDADFTHAAFHMGSSRSGLVFSPIACEGSRTGFYTDDYLQQDFLAPEEIRKANLCGANLIGAKVTGTDWYLVDLRSAKYEADQAEWFRHCGAILQARA